MLNGIADGCMYGGPYHIELDWVDSCNASCFFCNSKHLHDHARLSWDKVTTILDEAYSLGLRCLRLSGGGEPLLHPHLQDLLSWLTGSGLVLDNL